MQPQFKDHRDHFDEIIGAVLRAADPGEAVRRHWRALPQIPTLLLAIGKASSAMAAAAIELAGMPSIRGIVTTPPELVKPIDPRITVYPCDHPLPTDRNVVAAQAIAAAIRDMHALHGAEWQLLFLVSGGGSAHLTLPAPGLSLEDLRRLNTDLQRAGANIVELNAIRKRTEQLKGGRLGMLVHPARVWMLVASDVIGDPLDVIASGPVTGDNSSVYDAIRSLKSHGITGHAATLDLLNAIRARMTDDTPAPNDPRLAPVASHVICSNSDAVRAARDCVTSMGFENQGVRLAMTGDAGTTAAAFMKNLLTNPPASSILGGETTVRAAGGTGKGGPSQEFALVCAIEMARNFEANGQPSALLAFSTDGIDGPTDAAGAIVTHQTVFNLERAGINPSTALANHDSYTALDAVNALVRTGPTGTNVNHVAVQLTYPPEP